MYFVKAKWPNMKFQKAEISVYSRDLKHLITQKLIHECSALIITAKK